MVLKIYKNTQDITQELENYSIDFLTTSLLASDELVIGYYKPINALFAELGSEKNTNDSVLNLYYYNGTSFLTTPITDNTKGLSRSGFLKWNRNLANEQKYNFLGIEAYWYKIKVDSDTSDFVIKGLNLVFSDDNDLKEEYPSVMDLLPEGETSFIKFHVASRKDILSYFRAQGKLIEKYDQSSSLTTKKIDQFDLLDYEELRDASKFLALSKILYWVSDSVDDKWHQKASKYEQKYGEKINLVNISIDSNDDGKVDNNELNAIQSILIVRQ
jgi:hypothetical protein